MICLFLLRHRPNSRRMPNPSIFDSFNKTDFEGEVKLDRTAMVRLLNDKATESPEFLVVVINALIFGKRLGQDNSILSIGQLSRV